MSNNLLYGKAGIQGIVSLEVKDENIELFIRHENGHLIRKFISNRYWLLSHEYRKDWHKLKGNLYFQYGKQFTSRETFLKARQVLKHSYDLFSIYDQKESAMVLKGLTYYQGLKIQDLHVLSFDIETTGIDHNKDSKLLLISNTFRSKGKLVKKLFAYDDYKDEGEMIKHWCQWVRSMDPDIICGHNIVIYDFLYLDFIARKFDVTIDLGRDGSALKINNYESKFRKDGSQDLHYNKISIFGREIVDTLFLSYKHDIGRNYPSYGLKPIIEFEKLQSPNRTFYDASQIRYNYKIPAEWAKIKEYAKDDSDDGLKLFDLMAPAQFFLANMIPKPFQLITESATGSQINSMMIRSYLQEGHSIPKASEVSHFEGAIAIGLPGIHKNVLSFDVASLYPSIMLEYKVNDLFKDPQNNFLKILEILTNERLKNKKLAKETGNKYYKDMSESQKTLVNSGYGFKGAPGLNFNDPHGADFVTRKGREILQSAIKWATGKEFEEWKNENIID